MPAKYADGTRKDSRLATADHALARIAEALGVDITNRNRNEIGRLCAERARELRGQQ